MHRIKRNSILQVICCLLIFLFVYTAFSKFQEFVLFKSVLGQSPLIGNKKAIVAWALPTIELSVAFLLLIPKTQQVGLIASTILMLTFTVYVSYMILFAPHLPCSCGGAIKYMTWKQHLVFNIVFTSLAFVGVLFNRERFKNEQKILFA
jgi:hypothetical protein